MHEKKFSIISKERLFGYQQLHYSLKRTKYYSKLLIFFIICPIFAKKFKKSHDFSRKCRSLLKNCQKFEKNVSNSNFWIDYFRISENARNDVCWSRPHSPASSLGAMKKVAVTLRQLIILSEIQFFKAQQRILREFFSNWHWKIDLFKKWIASALYRPWV